MPWAKCLANPHIGGNRDAEIIAARTEVPGADILDPRRKDHQLRHVWDINA